MRQNKKKNFVIIALFVAIVAMGVGYAALTQVLTINGTASVGDAKWQVEITDIKENAMVGATTKGDLKYDATSATFAVDLAYPGATATYDITVANNGTIDAVLESVSGIEAANAANPVQIQYEILGATAGDKLSAKAGDSVDTQVVQVKVTWVADEVNKDQIPTGVTSKTATITLNYAQDTNA